LNNLINKRAAYSFLKKRLPPAFRPLSKILKPGSLYLIFKYKVRIFTRKGRIHLRQEKKDIQIIHDSGLFQAYFSSSDGFSSSCPEIKQQIKSYIRSWQIGRGCRKPCPGFHPGIYIERHGLTRPFADPFADYLSNAQPPGPWAYQVIGSIGPMSDTDYLNINVALHLHVYYPQMLDEIISRLKDNRIRADLFVSVGNSDAYNKVEHKLKEYKIGKVIIEQVPNRGRDIGPLLSAFDRHLFESYTYIGHIHTKKSPHLLADGDSQDWFCFLLDNLLGRKGIPMADRILAEMAEDDTLGMVFPDDPHADPHSYAWGDNFVQSIELAERMGLHELPEQFLFPAGAMFWARTSALEPIFRLGLKWKDYPSEPLALDGTVLHALERLLGLSPSLNSLRIATSHIQGSTW
jgi:hypothetical protein